MYDILELLLAHQVGNWVLFCIGVGILLVCAGVGAFIARYGE